MMHAALLHGHLKHGKYGYYKQITRIFLIQRSKRVEQTSPDLSDLHSELRQTGCQCCCPQSGQTWITALLLAMACCTDWINWLVW